MKKIYAYLLGVTYILSTSCSEMQRKQLFPDNIYVSTQAIPIPIYVNSNCLPQLQQPQQRYLCTVNQPGWEILNKIANAPYTANKPIVKKATDLDPIYRGQKKTIIPQEKKPSLKSRITPTEPDNSLMQQLYNDAYYVLYDEDRTPKKQLAFSNKFIDLITNLKNAKHKNIDEDLMATFAYEKWNLINNVHYYVAILFYCLKKYNLATTKTPEALPSDQDKISIQYTINTNDDFLKSLGIENTEPTSQQELSSSSNTTSPEEYPACSSLITSLYKLSQNNSVNIKTLISYLHTKQPLIIKRYRTSYEDLKKDFYNKAFHLLFIKKICNAYLSSNDLYDLLEIVDQIKDDHNKQEMELGHDILTIEKTAPIESKIIDFIFTDHYYGIRVKNHISVLCKLIKSYDDNLNKGTPNYKRTPTDEQCLCYLTHKKIDFTLPDSFDSALFDESKYALTEFLQLFDNIVQLKSYDAGSVQLFVNKIYPKKD